MITVLRKHIKSTLFKGVLWLFIIILGFVFLMPDTSLKSRSTPWIARVNSHEIDGITFEQNVAKQEYSIRMLRQQYGQYADMFMQMLGLSQDPKHAALKELIRDEVLNQVATAIPLYINRAYMDQKFNDLEFVQQSGLYAILPLGFFSAQGINEDALRGYLARVGINNAQFETMVEKALARHIVQELAGLAMYTPAYMIDETINAEFGQKSYAVLTFSLDTIKAEEKKKPISEQDLQAFFELHNKRSKRYWLPELRAGIVWEFDPAAYGITVSADEIQNFYDAQKTKKYVEGPSRVQVRRILFKTSENESSEDTERRLQEVRTELLAHPNDFARKAKEVSADKESAIKEGLIPFFAKGERDQAFERKAFMLKQAGDISEVFKTPEGFEIVQLVEKKPIQYKPLEAVKKEIEQILLQQAFAKEFSKDVKRLMGAPATNEQAIDTFAQSKSHKKTTVPLAEKDASKLRTTMFRVKSGEADFFIDANGYIVLVSEIKPRVAPALAAVQAAVEEDLHNERAENTLAERMEQAKEALKESDPASVAKTFAATFMQTGMLDKEQKDALEKLRTDKIPVDKMLQLGKKGSTGTHFEDKKGYVFYVTDTKPGNSETDSDKQLTAIARLQQERKSLFIEGFVASLSGNATIETNNSILNLSETQTL